jgi:hypothetical protein
MALATASLIPIDCEQRRTLSDICGSTSKISIRKLPPISSGRIPGRRKICVTCAGYVALVLAQTSASRLRLAVRAEGRWQEKAKGE